MLSITLGAFKQRVMHKIREFSNAGRLVTPAQNADYFLSMPSQINDELMFLATTIRKNEVRYDISHFMPENQIGREEFTDRGRHFNEDVIYMSKGSQAYSFEVSNTATIFIEEEQTSDVWTVLETINHTSSAGDGYTNYKGRLTLQDAENMVRIRFSGDFYYLFRFVALFAENFANDDDVPAFAPYVEYNLPADFYQVNKVDWVRPKRTVDEYGRYRLKTENTNEKKLLFPWFAEGEFQVHYFAYPPTIPDDATDDYTIILADEFIPALIVRVASMLQIDENTYISETLNQEYITMYNNLLDTNDINTSYETVTNANNW